MRYMHLSIILAPQAADYIAAMRLSVPRYHIVTSHTLIQLNFCTGYDSLRANGWALSRATLYSERTPKLKPDAKMAMILSPRAASATAPCWAVSRLYLCNR